MLAQVHYIDLIEGRFNLTTAKDLANLFDALENSAKKHLVVHLHGGLVSRASAEQTAEGLLPFFEQGGAYPESRPRPRRTARGLSDPSQDPDYTYWWHR